MKQRVKKRWEDHTITGIGRREARAAFYEDTSEKNLIKRAMEIFIFRGSGAVSGRVYECRH